ncbi:MAG: ATPase, T2SS/T4P/T4SS family [Lachnospiraceae bacterium]
MKITNEYWEFQEKNFGPFLPFIQDDNVTDINFNGKDTWIDDLYKGKYKTFLKIEPEFVNQFCTRIANVVSANFNKFDNLLEAETDTLRISIIHESAAHTGHSISIRKTPAIRRMNRERMIETGYCSSEILNLMENCVKGHMNMVFCGLPGSGKTELLKYLTKYIPHNEKVITIEDNLEIHYGIINPESNCVELKVDSELFPYTKAIKASLRQNTDWILLSEARSAEVKYLLESFSTGLHGLTTLHTDDVRKIPDRIQNMMQDSYAAERLENDVYSFINVGVMVRKKLVNQKIIRYVDQVCFFDRNEKDNHNTQMMVVNNGKIISMKLSANIQSKFQIFGIEHPFGEKGQKIEMEGKGI